MQLSPRGDLLYAAFMRRGTKQTDFSFGFLEIPLNGSPCRQTTLIPHSTKSFEHGEAKLFQITLSHDGKALAVDSTYAAQDQCLYPEDCALFLVDLAHPQRKVTKVPIPQPRPKPEVRSSKRETNSKASNSTPDERTHRALLFGQFEIVSDFGFRRLSDFDVQ